MHRNRICYTDYKSIAESSGAPLVHFNSKAALI